MQLKNKQAKLRNESELTCLVVEIQNRMLIRLPIKVAFVLVVMNMTNAVNEHVENSEPYKRPYTLWHIFLAAFAFDMLMKNNMHDRTCYEGLKVYSALKVEMY